MNRGLAAERRACELETTVRDHLVHVHVELGAATSHPNMQRKHVVVLTAYDFVADLDDQLILLVTETLAGVVGVGRSLLEGGIGDNHLPGHEIPANAEMLQGTLSLRTPELVRGHFNHPEAVALSSHVVHVLSPASDVRMLNNCVSSALIRPRAEQIGLLLCCHRDSRSSAAASRSLCSDSHKCL